MGNITSKAGGGYESSKKCPWDGTERFLISFKRGRQKVVKTSTNVDSFLWNFCAKFHKMTGFINSRTSPIKISKKSGYYTYVV